MSGYGACRSAAPKRPSCSARPAPTVDQVRDADFGEAAEAGFLDIVELGQRVVDILALLAQVFALFVDALHQQLELAELARRLLVDLDDLADFGDGEADAPAAQDFLNKATVGGRNSRVRPRRSGWIKPSSS